MKILVTHLRPDFDAAASCWLIKKYLPGWDNPVFKFVPAGTTLNNTPPDEDPNLIHVDTGLGKFDHHQFEEKLSATKRVFDHLTKENLIKLKDQTAVEKLVDFVNIVDNFGEIDFPDPTADLYEFTLYQLIEGLKLANHNDLQILQISFPLLDAVLVNLKNKIRAESELQEGITFQSKWGKTFAIESKNDETARLALKTGYTLVIRRDPEKGFLRFKTLPEKKYDLTVVYTKLKEVDSKATWFLHSSTNILLNGSSKNPNAVVSSLTLQNLVDLVKGI